MNVITLFGLTRDGWVIIWWSQTIIYFVRALAAVWPGQLRRRVTSQNFSDSQSLVATRQQSLSREGGTSSCPHHCLIALYSFLQDSCLLRYLTLMIYCDQMTLAHCQDCVTMFRWGDRSSLPRVTSLWIPTLFTGMGSSVLQPVPSIAGSERLNVHFRFVLSVFWG